MPNSDDQVGGRLHDDEDACEDDGDAKWSLREDSEEADEYGEFAKLLNYIVEDLARH